MELKLENGYYLDNDVLYLDLRFSGLGEVEREEGKIKRLRESFASLSLEGIPVTLEHPKDNENKNALINDDNSKYWVIGSILKEIPSDSLDEIRVIVRIHDKTFIDLFLKNKENIFNLLSSSPAVQSQLIKIDDERFFELVTKIDHLALLIESVGFWDNYVLKPALNENSKEEIKLEEIKLQDDNNKLITDNEKVSEMEIKEEVTSTTLGDELKKEELEKVTLDLIKKVIEEVKEGKDDIKEEIKEEVKEEKVLDEVKDEKKEEEIKEIKDEEVIEKKEEIIEKDIDEEVIKEEFETEEDKEREFLVTIASNLVDSIEDFRKPFYEKRVKPEVYLRKLLSMNKSFVDAKYHSVIDSISLQLGKEILSTITAKKKEKQELSSTYWHEIGNKRVRKF